MHMYNINYSQMCNKQTVTNSANSALALGKTFVYIRQSSRFIPSAFVLMSMDAQHFFK